MPSRVEHPNRDLASLIDESVEPFTELVDWWEKDDVQRQMRSKIKRHLRASGVGIRCGGEPRFEHRGSGQGAGGPMTAVETSAVTWGGTQLSYAIRRSRPAEEDSGGDRGSFREHSGGGAGTRRHRPAGHDRESEGRMARRGGSGAPVPTGPLLSPREFVSGESVLYLGRHYRLKVDAHEDTGRAKLRGGWLHVPGGEGVQDPVEVQDGSPGGDPCRARRRGSGSVRRSDYRKGWRRGMRRPASRCHTSSWPASRSAGAVATRPGPSA